jgi:mannose-6-phosphate isomerase-like protein (cupin superfamily)
LKKTLLLVCTTMIVALIPVEAQAPTCRMCPATYISTDEVQAYLARAQGQRVSDQQVRAVDIGKSQVAIGLIHREKLLQPAPASVAEHDLVSEVYHVISGSGTLMTGPNLVGAKRRPADNEAVRLLNGPGNNADAITGGVSHVLKPGDVVVIPAGTGHLWTRIDDQITYLMVRIDPDKATPLKDESASKADLSRTASRR